jgi:hypothetical protein
VVLLPVALLPDLALGVSHRLQPAHYPAAYAEARDLLDDGTGDVLVLPLSSYRAPEWNHRHLVLDPVGRYLTPDYVASDVLVVDGVPLAGEDPRVQEAAEALGRPTPGARAAALGRIGIGAVVTDPTAPGPAVPEIAGESLLDEPDLEVLALPHVDPREPPRGWVVAMGAAWAGWLALFGLALTLRLQRRRPSFAASGATPVTRE